MHLASFHRHLSLAGPRNLWEHLVALFLLPLGWLYGMVGWLRTRLYRLGFFPVYRPPVPVVSVGNLAVGGTGKTPAVDYIVKFFLARGSKVAVVSRGYRSRGLDGAGVVSAGAGPLLPAARCGDEPHLLASRNPRAIVLVAPRRADGVRLAVEKYGAKVVVLDDGFQHLAVARDLDLVLLDAERPLGNGQVLPAGLLREFPRALRRADMVVMTRSETGQGMPVPFHGPVLHCRHALAAEASGLDGGKVSLTSLVGKRGVAFAGIADPESFFNTLAGCGLTLTATLSFSDHARYEEAEVKKVAALAAKADYLVTTEKDGVKLKGVEFPIPCYQVGVDLEFHRPGVLEDALEALLRREGKRWP